MSSENIQPLGDRVAVRLLSEEEKGAQSPSGIIIPDSVSENEKKEQGRIVAVGAGRYENGERVPMNVKVGDRVVFSQYGFDAVKIGGEEYYIGSESSLLAVINE